MKLDEGRSPRERIFFILVGFFSFTIGLSLFVILLNESLFGKWLMGDTLLNFLRFAIPISIIGLIGGLRELVKMKSKLSYILSAIFSWFLLLILVWAFWDMIA
jgi:hypothetical protein